MKRYLWLAIIIVFLLGTVACQKKEKGPEGTERTKFVPEDYNPTNSSFMKTEKGIYYYNNRQRALRYYDFASEKDIYLCNKPECKHDGNAFCVATNARYSHEIHILYNGKIVAPAIEKTDTQYLMKLLVISLDGSQLEEYAHMLTVEKTPGMRRIEFNDVQIHRNIIAVTFKMIGDEGLPDAEYHCAFLYDMDTSETISLNEEMFSKENPEIKEIKGSNDYIYYSRTNGKRIELWRYHIVDKKKENCTPEPGFRGKYYFLGDDQLFYQRGDAGLGFYWISTKKLVRTIFNRELMNQFDKEWSDNFSESTNRRAQLLFELQWDTENKELKRLSEKYELLFDKETGGKLGVVGNQKWIGTDEKNIYYIDHTQWYAFVFEEEGQLWKEHICKIPLEVYDRNGEYQTTLDLMDVFAETGYFDEETEGYNNITNKLDLHFENENVFFIFHRVEEDEKDRYEYDRIYRLNRQEMLDGTAKAEFVCELCLR